MAASCLTPKMLCLISKHSVEIPDQVGNDRLVRKDGNSGPRFTWTFYSRIQRTEYPETRLPIGVSRKMVSSSNAIQYES